jgi:hypothetical protein
MMWPNQSRASRAAQGASRCLLRISNRVDRRDRYPRRAYALDITAGCLVALSAVL